MLIQFITTILENLWRNVTFCLEMSHFIKAFMRIFNVKLSMSLTIFSKKAESIYWKK